ncbi:hypothetical protein C8Q75DRAFT_808618 [Abortiporus biennis]|nr:hypothetical protein C8Q75DRAFT_808618 [Abortiporus biennis]
MSTATALPSISDVLGGLLVTIFVAGVLYGVNVAQTYMYWLTSDGDTMYIKCLVASVFIVETFHTVMCFHMAYYYSILKAGDLASIAQIVWSAGLTVFGEITIVCLVQSFYLRRIWILSKRNVWLTGFTFVVLFVRVGFGIASGIFTYTLPLWQSFREHEAVQITVTVGLGLSVAIDMLIAFTLMYFLQKGKTGFKETDNVIHKMIAFSVNTGLLTGIVSLAIVLTFALNKKGLTFAGLVQMSSKLYANSLMGTLNARQILRKGMSVPELSDRFQTSRNNGVTVQTHIEIFPEATKTTDDSYPMTSNISSERSKKFAELSSQGSDKLST